jgi:hypothetical protein
MLFVSFWNIALSNLTVGKFTNSAIAGLEAAALISSARANGKLNCVSADDLLAPYGRRAYEKHVDLCAALDEQGVELSVDDFIGPSASNPLAFAVVGGEQSLIVVNCAYTFGAGPRAAVAKANVYDFRLLGTRFPST